VIVDCNAYCGRWPFRRLGFPGAAGLAKLMGRTATDVALVSPLAGAFYRDCLSAVQEMLDDPGWDAQTMLPVAVVNPAFPGWRRDLETMAGSLGCVALRLLPNYHGYSLYEEGADSGLAVVEKAQGLGLPVILTMRMQDERSHHWHMLVDAVPVDEVRFLMRLLPRGKYVLSNVWFREARALQPELELVDDGAWEVSYKPPDHFVEDAVRECGPERLLYGSAAPLQYPECTLAVVRGADVSDEAKELMLAGNARRLFGVGGQHAG
jgi:uncharacterized protein